MTLNNSFDVIADMDLHSLRQAWRQRFGPPPRLRSTELLALALAFRLQADQTGGLGIDQRRSLRRPGTAPATSVLTPGTKLSREWQGVRHEVVVAPDGKLVWSDGRYASLSQVARAITGTRWNGPRFFGLREEGGR
ncbi:MAG: DUF2924 domain-containing protein [Brevundimonas sp.]|uniref:DUF2924 domain-containing protein n=1 Tax=Brevundimonas sp. TaxID=1871086 RepID=UPI00391CA821